MSEARFTKDFRTPRADCLQAKKLLAAGPGLFATPQLVRWYCARGAKRKIETVTKVRYQGQG